MDKKSNQDGNSVKKSNTDLMYKIITAGIVVISLLLSVIVLQLFFMNKYLRNVLQDNFLVTDNNTDTELVVHTATTKSIYEVMPDWTVPEESETTQTVTENGKSGSAYVINTNSKKIHRPSCSVLSNTNDENKKNVTLTDDELKEYLNGSYEFCKKCGG